MQFQRANKQLKKRQKEKKYKNKQKKLVLDGAKSLFAYKKYTVFNFEKIHKISFLNLVAESKKMLIF